MGLIMGSEGDPPEDIFDFNVPVQLTYLYCFKAFAAGINAGLNMNPPRAGYFISLVGGL